METRHGQPTTTTVPPLGYTPQKPPPDPRLMTVNMIDTANGSETSIRTYHPELFDALGGLVEVNDKPYRISGRRVVVYRESLWVEVKIDPIES